MCGICEQCKSLPIDQALVLIAVEMSKGPRPCLDELIGRLINVQEPERDFLAEAIWEKERES